MYVHEIGNITRIELSLQKFTIYSDFRRNCYRNSWRTFMMWQRSTAFARSKISNVSKCLSQWDLKSDQFVLSGIFLYNFMLRSNSKKKHNFETNTLQIIRKICNFLLVKWTRDKNFLTLK